MEDIVCGQVQVEATRDISAAALSAKIKDPCTSLKDFYPIEYEMNARDQSSNGNNISKEISPKKEIVFISKEIPP